MIDASSDTVMHFFQVLMWSILLFSAIKHPNESYRSTFNFYLKHVTSSVYYYQCHSHKSTKRIKDTLDIDWHDGEDMCYMSRREGGVGRVALKFDGRRFHFEMATTDGGTRSCRLSIISSRLASLTASIPFIMLKKLLALRISFFTSRSLGI